MTQTINCGPLTRLDGPPPSPPAYGLLPAAAIPGAGVRIVTEADERWGNGAELYPYPVTSGGVWAPYNTGADRTDKLFGDEGYPLANPIFGPVTLYLPFTCRRSHIWNDAEWIARGQAVFSAVESANLARELMTGAAQPLNPFLADGGPTCTFPNLDAATSAQHGLALLEEEIAKSGRLGLIHVSPLVATHLREHFALDNRSGSIKTILGNVVVADAGYHGGATPHGHAAGSGSKQWIFATGPIDIRRSDVEVVPDELSQGLDRGLGATTGRNNEQTYRVERHYLAVWDTAVHSAVLVDVCQDTC